MVNILLGVILLLGPVAGYFLSEKPQQGVMIGLCLAAFVLLIYILIERVPLDTLIFGGIGAGIGLFFARVLVGLAYKVDNSVVYNLVKNNDLLIYLFLGILGCMIAVRKKNEMDLLDKDIIIRGKKNKDVKVLDTSVLIDGRVADIVETGFVEGKLLVPRFVLHELQLVADSSDATKRQRGRRGLDILKRLQDHHGVNLKVYDKDYPHIKDVDTKVLELAKELGGKVATTDFNLNKVAALQGIPILNINDLAAALKSVVLPGDSLAIYLAKEGKEKAQAVGYLDDGTMVVVDEGKKSIGRRVGVHVNSILQTSAGRMIFARIQDHKDQPAGDNKGSANGPDQQQSIA